MARSPLPVSLARPATRSPETALWAVTLLAAAAHATFAASAGGFWRDEANTVAFASMGSLAELFAHLRYDSAPPAVALLLRGAIALGLRTDFELRLVGAVVGIGALAALLAGARAFGARLPVATLGLFSLNAWVIRGGDMLRPQGLAMVATALAFFAAAAVARAPSARRLAALAAAGAFAAACAWTTLPLLGALAAALAFVAAGERCARRAAGALVLLAGAALVVAPLLADIRAANAWSSLVRTGARPGTLLTALSATSRFDLPLWAALVALAAATTLAGPRARRTPATRFALVALTAGTAASLAFLWWSALPTQPWYHLPLLALACAALDLLLALVFDSPGRLAAAAAATALVAALHGFALFDDLRLRTTNVDLLAAQLSRLAGAGDFLVVTPWQLGVSYTRVAAPGLAWSTLPPLADTRIHRYDLVREAMRRPEVADEVNARALATLAAGRRVFVLGSLPPTSARQVSPLPPAAPSALGWNADAYTLAWTRHFLSDVMPGASSARPVAGLRTNVSPYEDAQLYVLEGPGRRPDAGGAAGTPTVTLRR